MAITRKWNPTPSELSGPETTRAYATIRTKELLHIVK